VIVLNGTASAGKTTLAHAVQRLADDPWIVIAQDDFAQNLAPRWVKVDGALDGGREDDGFHFVRDALGQMHVEVGEIGRRLLRGYRFAAGAVARGGSDVVVDECMFDSEGWDEWQEALAGLNVLWVRVECDLVVCDRRELLRVDRQQLVGLARGQYERAHADVRYDLVVDLTDGNADAAARSVLAAVRARG
jgi:chloramphenicol 3-O phosphotransferase